MEIFPLPRSTIAR